jgi:hypothetical protein
MNNPLFPDELNWRICSFLSTRDVGRFRRTCKKMSACIYQEETITDKDVFIDKLRRWKEYVEGNLLRLDKEAQNRIAIKLVNKTTLIPRTEWVWRVIGIAGTAAEENLRAMMFLINVGDKVTPHAINTAVNRGSIVCLTHLNDYAKFTKNSFEHLVNGMIEVPPTRAKERLECLAFMRKKGVAFDKKAFKHQLEMLQLFKRSEFIRALQLWAGGK